MGKQCTQPQKRRVVGTRGPSTAWRRLWWWCGAMRARPRQPVHLISVRREQHGRLPLPNTKERHGQPHTQAGGRRGRLAESKGGNTPNRTRSVAVLPLHGSTLSVGKERETGALWNAVLRPRLPACAVRACGGVCLWRRGASRRPSLTRAMPAGWHRQGRQGRQADDVGNGVNASRRCTARNRVLHSITLRLLLTRVVLSE